MAPPSTIITKLKVALKLSVSRLRMVQQRETALAKVNRRQMAQLLEQGKEESARIRVENIIRQDISVELMEILELYCELLLARVQLMEAKECDPGLEEAIKSIIYAAPRTEIKELQQARQLLVEKYGKEFALAAIENTDNKVGDRVLKKLRVEPPSETLVTLYLKEIARTYNVSWGRTPLSSPPLLPTDDDDEPSSAEAVALGDAELAPPRTMRGPVNVAPPSPTTENVHPTIKVPGATTTAAAAAAPRKAPAVVVAKKKNPLDDDDLAARFAALKRHRTPATSATTSSAAATLSTAASSSASSLASTSKSTSKIPPRTAAPRAKRPTPTSTTSTAARTPTKRKARNLSMPLRALLLLFLLGLAVHFYNQQNHSSMVVPRSQTGEEAVTRVQRERQRQMEPVCLVPEMSLAVGPGVGVGAAREGEGEWEWFVTTGRRWRNFRELVG